MSLTDSFDKMALTYDRDFSETYLGKLYRERVWQYFDRHFSECLYLLELNCGTGEDALYLGKEGKIIEATDISTEMIEISRRKVSIAGLDENVRVHNVSIESLYNQNSRGLFQRDSQFDGMYSNFGGLNCIGDIPLFFESISPFIKSGGIAVFCIMGPYVPWEWFWYGARLQLRRAFRRVKRRAIPWQGSYLYYHTIAEMKRASAPSFSWIKTYCLGTFVPPPYTEKWAGRHVAWIEFANNVEKRIGGRWPLPWFADHYVLVLRKN